MKKYLQEWEDTANKEGYVGKYRQKWLRHCQLLDTAGSNDKKWYAESSWFLDQNLELLFWER